jgi:hypothetical protein
MLKKAVLAAPMAALLFIAGYQRGAQAAAAGRVYELRTYYTHPGKLDALNARFRNHTTKLFEKHGMTNIGYWVPQDEPKKSNTLIYVLSHESREKAMASWKAFQADPEWTKARDASEAGGKIVEKVERVFMDPVDYSQLK